MRLPHILQGFNPISSVHYHLTWNVDYLVNLQNSTRNLYNLQLAIAISWFFLSNSECDTHLAMTIPHVSIMTISQLWPYHTWHVTSPDAQGSKRAKTCVDAVLLHLYRIQNTHTEYSSCFQKGSPVLYNGHTSLIQKYFTYVIDVKPLKFHPYLLGGQSDKSAYATYIRGLPFGLIPNVWFQEW